MISRNGYYKVLLPDGTVDWVCVGYVMCLLVNKNILIKGGKKWKIISI